MSPRLELDRDPQEAKPARKPVPLWAALALALGLIVLPALATGPLFAPFVILWALCALALSFRAKLAPVRNQRLRNLGIYVAAAFLSVAVHGYRIDAAQERGETLASAIKAYRADSKSYPVKLEALVPKYIGEIPEGAYGRFYYHLNKDNAEPFFFFVTLPPFGRRGYCFEEKCVGNLESHLAKKGWYDFD
jgi:hypothetical protein